MSDVAKDDGSAVQRYAVGDLIVDVGREQVLRGKEQISLPSLSFALLVALVRAAPNLVTYDDLMQLVWRGVIVSPETITQRVKLIRDALADDARAPRYIAGVRGRGYRIVAPVMPMPSIDEVHTSVPHSLLRPWQIAAAMSVLSCAAVFWFFNRAPPSSELHEAAVAVLPFENLSGNPDDEYLSKGLSDELLNTLANVPGLRVAARKSAAYFKDREATVQSIGETLGVRYLLEGSIRKSANKLRVSARLIDAREGYHIWSSSFDQPTSELLAMQTEIALAVVKQLEVPLIDPARAALLSQATHNEVALDLYLRARYHEDSEWELDSSDRAMAFYEQAIELDPEFAQALIGLARTLWLRIQIADREPSALSTRAAELLRRALELSPHSAEGHALLGRISADSFDLRAAEESIRRAEELGANSPIALEQLSQYYAYFGWPPEKGLRYARQWAVIDPLNQWAQSNVAIAFFHMYEPEQAIAAIDPVVARNSEWWLAHFVRTGPLMDLGRKSEALASAQRAAELHPSVDTRVDLAITYAQAGDIEPARELLKQLDAERADRHFPPTTRAFIAIALGDHESAVRALEAAYDERDRYLIPCLHEQRLIPLHNDPRFKRLVELTGQERRITFLSKKVSMRTKPVTRP